MFLFCSRLIGRVNRLEKVPFPQVFCSSEPIIPTYSVTSSTTGRHGDLRNPDGPSGDEGFDRSFGGTIDLGAKPMHIPPRVCKTVLLRMRKLVGEPYGEVILVQHRTNSHR